MGKNIFETLMGAVVLMVAVGFIAIAYQSGGIAATNGYSLSAKFDRVDGLSIGSEVRVSGLKVGSVINMEIDPKSYLAIVTFAVEDRVKLPSDSSAEIISDGLLGEKYLALIPGGNDKLFQDDDEITFTQSSISIESLIGKLMFNSGEEKASKANDSDDDVF